MWREINGVLHIDLKTAAARTGYNENHLRRLASQKAIYTVLEGHNLWTTEEAIIEYRAKNSRRKPRAGASRRRREGKK